MAEGGRPTTEAMNKSINLELDDSTLTHLVNHVNSLSTAESNHGAEDVNGQANPEHLHDIPRFLIVANVPDSVFADNAVKEQFELVFCNYGKAVGFQYLPSFHRVRVEYDCSVSAVKARIQLHDSEFAGLKMKCYFAQPIQHKETKYLQPPAPTKQFLISPPASPPVGWEQITECEPVVNYDLISAVAALAPGEAHELHPASATHPAIIVHVCENSGFPTGLPIQQTRCPERTNMDTS